MKALFFGTPEFAVPCLDALAKIATVVGVVCQPDRPVGRGLVLTAPPVKARALELGLPVVQPTKLRNGDFAKWVREQEVDVALVVAYGRILPTDVLSGPRLGCVNVHASILPKYRGAAPIVWAIVRGETESGVTLMQMDEGMDTGAMLKVSTAPITLEDTAATLSKKLSALGAATVEHDLPKYVAGELTPLAQDHANATMAPMLKKEDGRVEWSKPARAVHDHVRGMNPWPGGFSRLDGKVVKILETHLIEDAQGGAPGTVLVADKSTVLVACGTGAVALTTVQFEGKKAGRGVDAAMGRLIREGMRFE